MNAYLVALQHPTTPAQYCPADPKLAALVAKAIAKDPADAARAARVRRGAEIVERQGVRIENGAYLVGIYRYYPVTASHCPCVDMALRKKPCKHLFAKWLWSSLRIAASDTQSDTQAEVPMPHRYSSPQAEAEWQAILARPLPGPLQSLQRIASLELSPGRQCSGLVTIWNDGRLLFSPYDSDERIACTYAEIVL